MITWNSRNTWAQVKQEPIKVCLKYYILLEINDNLALFTVTKRITILGLFFIRIVGALMAKMMAP